MSYLLETIEDRLKYELGSKVFETEILRFELHKALAKISELEKQNDKNT